VGLSSMPIHTGRPGTAGAAYCAADRVE
jgi:hypothetical protein